MGPEPVALNDLEQSIHRVTEIQKRMASDLEFLAGHVLSEQGPVDKRLQFNAGLIRQTQDMTALTALTVVVSACALGASLYAVHKKIDQSRVENARNFRYLAELIKAHDTKASQGLGEVINQVGRKYGG